MRNNKTARVKIRDQKRLVIIALSTFFLFSLLIYQFYRLQIIDGEKWGEIAKKQHFFEVSEPFLRGTFYSNGSIKKGHPEKAIRLVVDIEKFHLYVDPQSIRQELRDPISRVLAAFLNLNEQGRGDLLKNFEKKSRNRRLGMMIDRETKDKILAWWQDFARSEKIAKNALYFTNDYMRSYPFGKLLGQVLHTVQHQKDEITKQAYPTGGLELAFNSYLQGKQGVRVLKRSPRNSFETGKMIVIPENGADIYLTINHVLQEIAEEELETGVKRSRAKGGWAVMIDPHNGDILALAQYPFFYPMEYKKYFNDPEKTEHTTLKAVSYAYEPGSVFKPITLAIALIANQELIAIGEEPLFDQDGKIPCSDGHFPGRKKEIRDVGNHKFLNMHMAVQKSSNRYFARLAERIIDRLGDEWYRDKLERVFGFGKKTGIEFPLESYGLLPTPGKLNPNKTLQWSKPTPFSLAIGHNLQVNSVQFAAAFASLVNGGYRVKPTVVKKIVKKTTNGENLVILDKEQKEPYPVLDENIAHQIAKAMKFVTKMGGTGRRADIYGYTEGGKSGTPNKIVDGKYSEKHFLASFIGFTPAENPVFLLYVIIDEPECMFIPGVGHNHHGGLAAAPVFKDIAKRSLEYLGIPFDDPCGWPYGDPRLDREKADMLQENSELLKLYEKWNL